MKKYLVSFLVCMLFIQINAQKITATQWQQDLRFLQKTINEEYPFLFKKTTQEEFNNAVEKLHKEIPNLEDHEVIVGLNRIISLFKYGHMYVGYHQEPFKFSSFPFHLYHYNDGIFIQGTNKAHAKALGAKVIAIEGVPIDKALEIIYPTFEAENEYFFKAYGINNLKYPEVLHTQGITKTLQSSIELTLEKDGKKFKQEFKILPNKERVPLTYSHVQTKDDWLDARNQNERPLYLKNFDKIYYYEYLPEHKTVYVRHSRVRNDASESIEAFYKRVFEFIEKNDVEKLVLDVRLNGGGNNYLTKPIITGVIEAKKINQVGKFFVITGGHTYSACQNLVNRLHNYTNAIFVGEPTGENVNFYGDARSVTLPNSKIDARLSFAWWQDNAPWEDYPYLTPQISADMSFAQYANNEDPVLDTALNFNAEGFILKPMKHITDLFMKGDIETLQKDVQKMLKDPRYKFFDFEGNFVAMGELLINQKQYQPAIGVFSLVAQTFPNSAKAWKGLAEGYLKAGDKAKATEYYNKVISINPESEIATEAKQILNNITGE